jgi:hypothetical protein
MWKIDPNDKDIHKNKQDYMQTYLPNMFLILEGTILWNSGKEEKEKRMIEHQQYCKT